MNFFLDLACYSTKINDFYLIYQYSHVFFNLILLHFLLSIVKNLILVNFCWIFPDLDHDKTNHSKLLVQSLTCVVFHSPASPCCLFTFLFLLFCLLPNTSPSHTSCLHFSFEYLSHGTPGYVVSQSK